MAGRHPTHGFARSDRIAEQVRRELADLLRHEVKDPRLVPHLSLLTLTDVEVSGDYTHAKVFYTTLGGESAQRELASGLARLAGFLRRELGRRKSGARWSRTARLARPVVSCRPKTADCRR